MVRQIIHGSDCISSESDLPPSVAAVIAVVANSNCDNLSGIEMDLSCHQLLMLASSELATNRFSDSLLHSCSNAVRTCGAEIK